MMNSMTAFGRGRKNTEGYDVSVEIKSVNSRYLDVSVRLPRLWSCLEERIKPYLQAHGVSRGKVEINILMARQGGASEQVQLNLDYAEAYVNALRQLRDKYGLPDDITTMSVASEPNVFNTDALPDTDPDEAWEKLLPALDEAFAQFMNARDAEGARLHKDMQAKVDEIASLLQIVEAQSEGNAQSYGEKLAARIRQALQDNQITIDESRILTESAIYADKIAIDEELTRLRSHMEAFREISGDGEPAGRRLDFLLQEMNRETNTIGSKCSNADIAHLVVNIKNILEKIREQIQNIE